MAYSLYVKNLPPDITIEDLIIYFQSAKSGGGDVDSDASKLDGNTAVVVFEGKQDLDGVLQNQHEIDGHKLEVSGQPIKPKPVPKKRTKLQSTPKAQEANREKAYLGEVRTVIVSGIWSETTDETLKMFFENERRSGGGEIEKFERCSPGFAHITFFNTEVAAEVLKNKSLELEGYRLQLKEKQPWLILPLDRKKLYVENISSKTTKDGLQNYLELVTRKDVLYYVQFGDNNNALATLDDEPDMRTVQERSGIRPLDGADLKISNPPVCNSVLITGLNKNTTKQTIEMYFENERNGGGKIYGDIIYQRDQGKAVVSFCDPSVIKSLISREHELNGSVLSVHQHYQFMQAIKEIAIRKIELNADIVNHVVKNCGNKIRALFGIEVKEIVKESKEELNLPDEIDEATFGEFQDYMNSFAAKEVPICNELLESGKEELDALITTFSKNNFTLAVEEELLCVKLVGNKRDVDDVYKQMRTAVDECEKGLNVVTEEQNLPEHKLQLFLLHGIDETLKKDFQVDVTIDLQNRRITLKGAQEKVSLAVKSVLKKCAQISEESIDLSLNGKKFMESGGLDVLNRELKAKDLKGMVCLSGPNRDKGKLLAFDATTCDDIRLIVSDNMHEKTFPLADGDSVTLLKSNQWQEFYDDVTSNTSVKIYTDASKAQEISLIGKKSEVGLAYDKLETFMKLNTIVKETVQYGEGCTRYLNDYCRKDLEEIGKKLEDHFVEVHTKNGGIVQIDGTKEGVREAKLQLEEIVENIAKGTLCFDKKRERNYLESEEGKMYLRGIESGKKCAIELTTDDREQSAVARPSPIPRYRSAKEIKRKEWRVAQIEPVRRKPGDQFIITKRNMKISVVVGDLSRYKADVLVNTTGESLQLDLNPCSKALSNEAGPVLQAECSKIGKLQVGDVAVTQGGNLLCDEVYHVVCVPWSNGQGIQVLRSIIQSCLQKCNRSGKKSIAFPAIGTGILGFPHGLVAKIFFQETKQFDETVVNCNIRDVSFVVYNQDAKSIQAFKDEFKKQARWSKNASSTTGSPTSGPNVLKARRRYIRGANTKSRFSKMGTNEEEREEAATRIEVGDDKAVEIVKGDITKESTDVIAHLTNPGLSMRGGIGSALARSGGQDIERECKDEVASVKLTGTVLTTAGRLNANYVAHMVASANPDASEIEKCLENCLRRVAYEGCRSISFPAVGAGQLKDDPEKAAEAVLASVLGFLQSNPEHLRTVRIVLDDDDLVKAFVSSAKQLKQEFEPVFLQKVANFYRKTESATINVKERLPANTKKVFLEIYAKDEATVNAAKEKIQTVIEKQKKKEKIEDENIGKLSAKQISEITQLCETNDLRVIIDKEIDRIILSGHTDDISTALNEIYQILKKIGQAEKEKEKAALRADLAEMTSQGVQWFWVDSSDDDEPVEYEKRTNAIIEKAYSKNEKSVLFLTDNERCEIVFDKMLEHNLVKNENTRVFRTCLKGEISVPDYWDPQPRDPNGKELTVHLVSLDPYNPKHKNEYKKVSDHFHQTSSQPIDQIHRIQNPALYKQYAMMKRRLDGKNGSNEKFLFHGTNGDQVNTINESGLNRNYAGIDGSAFGRGVYFTRNASMSAGYACVHPYTNMRYMYYTRVAVGQYAVGDSSMVVPPQKGGITNDSYDSTVNNVRNPTVFVMFYDNQYYPEYLITFS